MGKVNRNISFDKDFLNKLKNDSNACVNIHTQIYHLALHPFHLTDLNASVKGLLNEKIAKFDNKFNGILLGYQNIKLLDSAGAINTDSCFIHTNIQADFYIFNPAVGQVLNGVVNKKSKDHVGCLVHRTFNVSLPKPENCDNWIGQSAQIGQEIKFEIIFTDLEGRLPYIKGNILSILSDDSGFSTSEEQHIQNVVTKFDDSDTEIAHKPKKKKKRKSEKTISLDVELVHEVDSYSIPYVENPETEEEIVQQSNIDSNIIEVKKLKKKKKDKPDISDFEARTLKKRKKDKQDNSDYINNIIDIGAENDRKLKKNKLFDKINEEYVEMKRSKKSKDKFEDAVILDNVEMSYNTISKTHKKHKHSKKQLQHVCL